MVRDADNRLLWRKAPHRLEAEIGARRHARRLRLLEPEAAAAAASPITASETSTARLISIRRSGGAGVPPAQPVPLHACGAPIALARRLRLPRPVGHRPARALTTTPLQALALLNNAFVLRMAEAFAQRVGKEANGIDRQVTRVWQLAYQRDPTAEEARLAGALVRDRGLKALCRVVFNSNEFVTVE